MNMELNSSDIAVLQEALMWAIKKAPLGDSMRVSYYAMRIRLSEQQDSENESVEHKAFPNPVRSLHHVLRSLDTEGFNEHSMNLIRVSVIEAKEMAKTKQYKDWTLCPLEDKDSQGNKVVEFWFGVKTEDVTTMTHRYKTQEEVKAAIDDYTENGVYLRRSKFRV